MIDRGDASSPPSPPMPAKLKSSPNCQQTDGQQHRLGDHCRNRVEYTRAHGHRDSEALLLEEADDQCCCGDGAADEAREVVGELDCGHRSERQWCGNGTEHGDGTGELWRLGHDESAAIQPQAGFENTSPTLATLESSPSKR